MLIKKSKKFQAFFNRKGLSLIEMLVVVGILAFIMSVIARGVNQRRKKSQVNQAKFILVFLNKLWKSLIMIVVIILKLLRI